MDTSERNPKDSGTSKACVICGEEIRAIARRCRYCHGWQTRLPLDPNDPRTVGIAFVVLVALGLLALAITCWPRPPLDEGFKQLKVSSAQLTVGQSGDKGVLISVSCRVQNPTRTVWHNLDFNVFFFDAAGKQIELVTSSSYAPLPAVSEEPFVINIVGHREPASYHSVKVAVRWARPWLPLHR